MIRIVLDDLLKGLSHGKLTYEQVESALLRYHELERKTKEALDRINHPVVKKEIVRELQYRFENGKSFTLEDWNKWREQGWKEVFKRIKELQ